MKSFKKVIIVLLTVFLCVVSLAGCTLKKNSSNMPQPSVQTTRVASEATQQPEAKSEDQSIEIIKLDNGDGEVIVNGYRFRVPSGYATEKGNNDDLATAYYRYDPDSTDKVMSVGFWRQFPEGQIEKSIASSESYAKQIGNGLDVSNETTNVNGVTVSVDTYSYYVNMHKHTKVSKFVYLSTNGSELTPIISMNCTYYDDNAIEDFYNKKFDSIISSVEFV